MKVRNNKNADYDLTFSDGHSIKLSRGEITRELTESEISDYFFTKALKRKHIVVVREKPVIKEKAKVEETEEVEEAPKKKKPKKKFHGSRRVED